MLENIVIQLGETYLLGLGVNQRKSDMHAQISLQVLLYWPECYHVTTMH